MNYIVKASTSDGYGQWQTWRSGCCIEMCREVIRQSSAVVLLPDGKWLCTECYKASWHMRVRIRIGWIHGVHWGEGAELDTQDAPEDFFFSA